MGDMRKSKSRRQEPKTQHHDQLPQSLQQQQKSECEQSEGVAKGMEFGEDSGMDEEDAGRSTEAVQQTGARTLLSMGSLQNVGHSSLG